MIERQEVGSWMAKLASKAPVPGGGGACALSGAMAAALGQMVANLTVGKKRYAEAEPQVRESLGALETLQSQCMALADRDAEVFAPLAAAYRMPEENQQQRLEKQLVMEQNLLAASLVPLELMEKALAVLEEIKLLEQVGSRMAVSDAGAAAQLARASLTGAAMNVYINTKSMKNRKKALELNERARELAEVGTCLADEIYERVLAKLEA